MPNDWKMRLYGSLPIAWQEAALSLYAGHLDRVYHGRAYEAELRRLEGTAFRSAADVRAWQEQALRTVLADARAHTPYYRALDLPAGAAGGIDGLPRWPLLDKQRLRQRERDFLDERFDPRRLITARTSGTTGTSLAIQWDRDSHQRFWAAYEVRVRRAAGVDRDTPRAMMGGRPIVPGAATRPPFWRYNRRWRQLYLSSYHVSTATAPGYVEAIRRAGSQWITGYGSAIAALAESALAAGLPPLPLKVAVVSGDTLQPEMRRSIEAFFQCRCYDQYGQSEGVCWIMECAHGRMHVSPEFGLLEILDADGRPAPAGEAGEMVVTGLMNRAMPLIRYRIGDEAAWSADQSCPCGQPCPVIERLEGRVDDYLVTADGRRIGRLSTAVKASPSIHSAQLVQDAPGHAFLLVRGGQGYRPADGLRVRGDLLERIGPFAIDLREVPEVPRTPAGKIKLVVRIGDDAALRARYAPLFAPSPVRSA